MTYPSVEANPELDHWIEIIEPGKIRIHTGNVDIGLRISTALALIAADELDVEYDRIDVKRTETQIDPNEGLTSGSLSIQNSGMAIRLASATARRFLMERAAKKLGVDLDSLEVTDGLVRSRETNISIDYWELMAGNNFNILINPSVKIKHYSERKIGNLSVEPKDIRNIVRGKSHFLHDKAMANVLHARLIRPPHYTARLKSIDEALVARLIKSNIKVVRDGNFLAIASCDEYLTIKSAKRLAAAVKWDEGEGLPSADLFEALISNERISLPVVAGGMPIEHDVVPIGQPLAEASKTISARFEKPYHMHGSIGPSAGKALYKSGILTIWTHNQGVYPLRAAIAEALNMEVDSIHVIFEPGSGCYGHNGADDAAYDAAVIACAIPDTPILLKWTREDEHAWEPYGTAMVCKMRASLDQDGRVIEWSHESYGDTHMGRPTPGRSGSPAEKLVSTHLQSKSLPWPVMLPAMGPHIGIHRNLEPLYDFPNPRLVKHLVRGLPLRVSALRSLGAFANVCAIEAFVEELAEVANVSPIDFRIAHLSDKRAIEVIRMLGKIMSKANAGAKDSLGAGIGFAQYKNSATYCAIGIELEVNDAAEIRLHRAWIVADAGEVVDRDGLVPQLEGGLIQAASWSLMEEVTNDSGGITSRDWDGYPILGFNNIPSIETTLIEKKDAPFLGAGEASSGPTGGAIINAVYDAIGVRLRRMPFKPDAIRLAAMS